MTSPEPEGVRQPLLLLVRHARAEETHHLGDGARALTPQGRTAFRAHARALVRVQRIGTGRQR